MSVSLAVSYTSRNTSATNLLYRGNQVTYLLQILSQSKPMGTRRIVLFVYLCILRSKYSPAYSHLSSENDRSNMITVLVFRKIAANDSLQLLLKFHKQCKYPQDWKTTNYFYIYKTIASVNVPVVEHLGCHSREVSRFCVGYALKPKKQLSIGHIQQSVFSMR